MARSRGRSAAPRAQTRSSSSMTLPRQASAPAPAPVYTSQRQPGLFSQMASTAAGVAVGSAVGHTVANGVGALFGGGSAEPQQYAQQQQMQAQPAMSASCEDSARGLSQCLEQSGGDSRVCQWYMDKLKSCLAASSSYN